MVEDPLVEQSVMGVPLSHVPPAAHAVVKEVCADGRGILSRLATLGFTPGAPLTVLQNFGHGPLIVAVRDTRIALGRGEAGTIYVIVEKNGKDCHE